MYIIESASLQFLHGASISFKVLSLVFPTGIVAKLSKIRAAIRFFYTFKINNVKTCLYARSLLTLSKKQITPFSWVKHSWTAGYKHSYITLETYAKGGAREHLEVHIITYKEYDSLQRNRI